MAPNAYGIAVMSPTWTNEYSVPKRSEKPAMIVGRKKLSEYRPYTAPKYTKPSAHTRGWVREWRTEWVWVVLAVSAASASMRACSQSRSSGSSHFASLGRSVR